MDVFAFLKANPVMRGFTDDGIRIIQSVVAPRQLEPGQPVFVEKMMGESAFLLGHGEVSVHCKGTRGVEREIGTLFAPDIFGELSLLQPGPRRVSVKARTQCLLFEIPRRDFLRLQGHRPQACFKLVANLTEGFAMKAAASSGALEKLCDAFL